MAAFLLVSEKKSNESSMFRARSNRLAKTNSSLQSKVAVNQLSKPIKKLKKRGPKMETG